MTYKPRIVCCLDCGASFTTRRPPDWEPRCKTCAVRNHARHVMATCAKRRLAYGSEPIHSHKRGAHYSNGVQVEWIARGRNWKPGGSPLCNLELDTLLRMGHFDADDMLIDRQGRVYRIVGQPCRRQRKELV